MKIKRFVAFLLTLITVFNLLPLSTVASAESNDDKKRYTDLFPDMEEESTTENDLFDVTIRTEGNGGYASGGGSFTYGRYVYLYAEVFPDAQFEGWYIDDELVSSSTMYGFYIYKDVEVVAKFSDTEVHSVIYDSGTGGIIENTERSYPANYEIRLNAVANEGYTFSYWSADGDVFFDDITYPYTTFTMPDEDVVITAHWKSDCMHYETENDVVIKEGTCRKQEIIEGTCTLCGDTVRRYGYYGDHNYVVVEVDWEYCMTRTCEDCGTTNIRTIPREVNLESIVYSDGYWSYRELSSKAYANNSAYIYASDTEIDFIISDPDLLEIEEAFDAHYNTYQFTFKKTGIVKVSVVSEYDHTIHYNDYTFEINDKPKAGDINGDGTLNSADARLILRVAAKISDCSNVTLQYADTDGNGTVSAGDARIALRVSAKIEDESVLAEFIPEQNDSWYYDNMMSYTMTEGGSRSLDYFIVRQDSPVTWKSSNPAAVKVDKNGKITAVKKGFSCIIVSNGSETFYYEVKVKNALQNKIDTFRNKYPDGYYWNNHTPSKTYPHVTETPCNDHESGRYAYCKGQCAGFADLMFREVHGNVKKSYGVTWDNVKIGDYIRLKPHHSVFVMDVIKKGDIIGYDYYNEENIVADQPYLIVVHCNWGMTCNIIWDDMFTPRYNFDTSLCYTVKK